MGPTATHYPPQVTPVEGKDIVEFSWKKKHIYMDISAKSTYILVKYSLLHVWCSHGCFVCIWHYLDQN